MVIFLSEYLGLEKYSRTIPIQISHIRKLFENKLVDSKATILTAAPCAFEENKFPEGMFGGQHCIVLAN